MSRRGRARGIALGWFLLAFGVGASVPAWTIWGTYTPEERARGRSRLFEVEVGLGDAIRNLVVSHNHQWHHRRRNGIVAGILVALSGGAAWVAFRATAPKERQDIDDYVERSEGSVKDGRS
jgi:hypothetical protein